MFFEKTSVWRNPRDFGNRGWILAIACSKPNFYNTEILLRGDRKSVNIWSKLFALSQAFANQSI
jgi:hypothetical protein